VKLTKSESLRGLREVTPWTEPTRLLVIQDDNGVRRCSMEIPEALLTDRVAAILEELTDELCPNEPTRRLTLL
jgi:hypothetical protein